MAGKPQVTLKRIEGAVQDTILELQELKVSARDRKAFQQRIARLKLLKLIIRDCCRGETKAADYAYWPAPRGRR